MKCEKCREKEATFFYSSNINGKKNERHLCADCAREEGFGSALDYDGGFGSFFDDMFSGFGDFFAPTRRLLSSFGSFGMSPRSIMAPVMPRVNIVIGEPETRTAQSAAETKIPSDAGTDVKSRRELAALKEQLAAAVESEDFEKAIGLRDQIRKLENRA